MWSHTEWDVLFDRDTALTFDEEPQGVIFSLARAQRWLRHAALLLGSLSTAACLHSVQAHGGLCLPHPTGILGTSGAEPQQSVLYISRDTWVCPWEGMPALPWKPWLGAAAPCDPAESCVVDRELSHWGCADWVTLGQDVSDTNAFTSNNHILHSQNYLWLKTSKTSSNWKLVPFFLIVHWTI